MSAFLVNLKPGLEIKKQIWNRKNGVAYRSKRRGEFGFKWPSGENVGWATEQTGDVRAQVTLSSLTKNASHKSSWKVIVTPIDGQGHRPRPLAKPWWLIPSATSPPKHGAGLSVSVGTYSPSRRAETPTTGCPLAGIIDAALRAKEAEFTL